MNNMLKTTLNLAPYCDGCQDIIPCNIYAGTHLGSGDAVRVGCENAARCAQIYNYILGKMKQVAADLDKEES